MPVSVMPGKLLSLPARLFRAYFPRATIDGQFANPDNMHPTPKKSYQRGWFEPNVARSWVSKGSSPTCLPIKLCSSLIAQPNYGLERSRAHGFGLLILESSKMQRTVGDRRRGSIQQAHQLCQLADSHSRHGEPLLAGCLVKLTFHRGKPDIQAYEIYFQA